MTRVKQLKRLEALERKVAPVETNAALDAKLYLSGPLYQWVRNKLDRGGFALSNEYERKMYDLLELAYARRIASEQSP